MAKGVAVWVLLIWALPSCVEARYHETDWNLSLSMDNDSLAQATSDRHYTHGSYISAISGPDRNSKTASAPLWVFNKLFSVPGNVERQVSFGVGQVIMTPASTYKFEPAEGDLPYAGYLFFSQGAQISNSRFVSYLGLNMGVVGPESGGESTQRSWHEAISVPFPQGWSNQLPTQYMFNLESRNVRDLESSQFWALSLLINASYGNLDQSLEVGTIIRLGLGALPQLINMSQIAGFGLNADISPMSSVNQRSMVLYAGLISRFQHYNHFIDGSGAVLEQALNLETRVARVVAGLLLQADVWSLRVGYQMYSKVFTTQTFANNYGTIQLSRKL